MNMTCINMSNILGLQNTVTNAITVIPLTKKLDTYHPNKVLKLNDRHNQIQDIIDSVTIKKTKKPAEILKFFL
jgi:hypothetical protein